MFRSTLSDECASHVNGPSRAHLNGPRQFTPAQQRMTPSRSLPQTKPVILPRLSSPVYIWLVRQLNEEAQAMVSKQASMDMGTGPEEEDARTSSCRRYKRTQENRAQVHTPRAATAQNLPGLAQRKDQ